MSHERSIRSTLSTKIPAQAVSHNHAPSSAPLKNHGSLPSITLPGYSIGTGTVPRKTSKPSSSACGGLLPSLHLLPPSSFRFFGDATGTMTPHSQFRQFIRIGLFGLPPPRSWTRRPHALSEQFAEPM